MWANDSAVSATFKLDGLYTVKDLVEDTETKMLDSGLDIITVKILGSFERDEVVYAGFVPYFIALNDGNYDLLVAHYLEKLSTEEEEYWFSGQTMEDFEGSDNVDHPHYAKYLYANLKGWKDFTVKTAVSFPLLLFFPDQLYASKRPKTDMSQFRQVTSATYDPRTVTAFELNPLFKVIFVNGDEEARLAVPVTRYSEGMTKGLFFETYDENVHCGTFYYYEPESTAYLTFNTVRVYRNKYDALLGLHAEFNIKKGNRVEKDIEPPWNGSHEEHPLLKAYYLDRGSLPANLKMTINEFFHPYEEDKDDSDYEESVASLPSRRRYVGALLGLYAKEDKYDQDLCRTARENNIDIIVLTDMIGRHQIVTEVLDSRSRQLSMSNLVYPKAL